MAILQSPIRCHKSYKTHLFLPSPALQGKLLGFQCTQVHDLWSYSKYRPTLCSWTCLSPPAPSPMCIRWRHFSDTKYSGAWPWLMSPVPAPDNAQVWGQDNYFHRTLSQSQKKCWWISASPAQRQPRHPCSELLELGGWHRASPGLSRTCTQLKLPAGAKLALCRGSVTHLCAGLQCIPEWTYYAGYCITDQLIANWWEPEKLVRPRYKRRLQKRTATSSWTQWCWCLSGMGIPPVTCSCSSVWL